ncbi:MAG: hypothetical protein AMXMBFR7_29240 [Planctomycetota bacterium]
MNHSTVCLCGLLAMFISCASFAGEDVTPASDPAPEFKVDLVPNWRNKHPRLLFGKEDIPRMQAFAKGEGAARFAELEKYFKSCRAPEGTPDFLKDATDGQRHGLWKAPTVGMYYLLTGDKKALAIGIDYMKLFLRLDHWELGAELDSGMSSANVAIGAALLYDWLYDELEPEFRAQYRDKLLLMARRQYHLGHLNKAKSIGYWQGDPQNNHRWHRNAGLALCALAAADMEKTDDDWILAKLKEELDFVANYLPEDGTCHESSSYMIFGGAHLTLAMQAASRCLGADYLKNPFFKNQALFRMHVLLPGLTDSFHYGDSGGIGAYNNYLYQCAAQNGLKDIQAGLLETDKRNEGAFWVRWFDFVWLDPELKGGSYAQLHTTAFWPDLGMTHMRDGWEKDNVGAMFKCGPFGGIRLNEYRNEHNFKYVNVAHDDPDANSFLIYTGGELVAETSRYSKHKRSANHNTILVNGTGQMAVGRPEGGVWSQPATGQVDMLKMAQITAFKDAGDLVITEGEAAGSYLATKDRPKLERFRRTFIWAKGRYLLVLDDIRAAEEAELTWLMQSQAVAEREAGAHVYALEKKVASCEFQVAADKPLTAKVVDSTADGRGKPLGWKQLQLSAKTQQIRIASVFDPWKRGGVHIALAAPSGEAANVTVKGPDFEDVWTWPSAAPGTPTALVGKVKEATISLEPQDAPPVK